MRGGEGRAGSGEREPSERRPGTVSRFHAWLRGVTGEGKAESAAPPWVVSPDAFFFFFGGKDVKENSLKNGFSFKKKASNLFGSRRGCVKES